MRITELEIENLSIDLLESLGHQYIYGPDIAPGLPVRGRMQTVDLYDEIVQLLPHWHSDGLSKGGIKVVSDNQFFHKFGYIPVFTIEYHIFYVLLPVRIQ